MGFSERTSTIGIAFSPSFLIVNGGSPAERENVAPPPAPGRLPCGENGEEWIALNDFPRYGGATPATTIV